MPLDYLQVLLGSSEQADLLAYALAAVLMELILTDTQKLAAAEY